MTKRLFEEEYLARRQQSLILKKIKRFNKNSQWNIPANTLKIWNEMQKFFTRKQEKKKIIILKNLSASVLSQSNTRLRILHFLYNIDSTPRKTIKHAFTIFYTLIKHWFLTNQSVHGVLSKRCGSCGFMSDWEEETKSIFNWIFFAWCFSSGYKLFYWSSKLAVREDSTSWKSGPIAFLNVLSEKRKQVKKLSHINRFLRGKYYGLMSITLNSLRKMSRSTPARIPNLDDLTPKYL